MKKLIILLAAVTMVFGIALSAQASLVTITFDEEGRYAYTDTTATKLVPSTNGYTNPGNVYAYVQGDGELITDQYAYLGINWVVDPGTLQPHNEVTQGEMFNNPFDVTDATEIGDGNQILWLNGNPVNGTIQLDYMADYLSVDFRRPSATQQYWIYFAFYDSTVDTDNPFYTGSELWDTGDWETFIYDGSSGYFDKAVLYCTNKFVIDNLSVNMVPIPPSALLLATGLIALVFRRKKS